MNEHDSERIAGLLAADGHGADRRPRRRRRRRPQHLLHPGERRQQALRPPRPAQGAEGGAARPPDRGRRLPGPEGPGPDRRAGRPRRRRVRHPQPRPRTRRCSPRARREGPIVEILEEHEAYPSALPARREVDHSAWVTIQIGCDNSCAFCIVPSVRGKEVSRRLGDIVHEVEELAADGVREITLLGQNVNSYGRDLGAGQYRPQFADLLRAVDAVDGIDRIRFTSPHPKDLRPETIAAMAECARCASTCTCRCSRAATARWRACTAATPRRATSSGSRRPAPRSRTSRSPPTSSSASPARPTTTSSARSRSSTTPRYDAAYTFVFSPRPGTEAAEMVDDFVAAEVVQERMPRLVDVVERYALATARGAGRPGRGGAGRGAVEEGRRRARRPHPAEQARPLRRPTAPASPPAAGRRRAHHRRRAALAAGRARRRSPRPAAPGRVRIPVAVV